tara:strand:- start:72 stop:530 length:459 start_codon:yes stop_codon:yes gene_type:complete
MTKKIKFVWKNFDELTSHELYAVLHLRQEVFVVEQHCPYLDADNSDQNAFHLLCYEENVLIAYLRAFKPGVKYEGSSLGRIVTKIDSRGHGIGKEITKEGVKFLKKEYPNFEIVISAQHRLKHFYIDLGFTPRGEIYLEDDIDHIQMYSTSK